MKPAGIQDRPRRSRAPRPVAIHSRRGRARRGTILIVTMWIVLVLAGLVLVLGQAMRVEAVCSANAFSAQQAEAVELGAIQYVLSHVDSLGGDVPSEANTPCQAVRVGQGAFWILDPYTPDDHTYAYGIVDEASKLNLTTASQDMLDMLPDMTDELAASIIDWQDSDDDVSPNGGENEYYLSLPDPYYCKNSPMETVEELFLVKGATRDIILGEDINRNGVLDANEDTTQDGRLDHGLLPYVTVYSATLNTTASGLPRLNVNDANSQALSDLLQGNISSGQIDVTVNRIRSERRTRPFRNVLDFYFRSGLTISQFQVIEDLITTTPAPVRRGLINVNTAPAEVLACLPGLDSSDVSALLAGRAENGSEPDSLAWVTQALTVPKATAIGGLITGRAYQFSADIVSVSGDGRAFRRCRIVVDARSSPPRVIYRQDLTYLGWPLAPEILTMLRAGASLDEVAAATTTGQEVLQQ